MAYTCTPGETWGKGNKGPCLIHIHRAATQWEEERNWLKANVGIYFNWSQRCKICRTKWESKGNHRKRNKGWDVEEEEELGL